MNRLGVKLGVREPNDAQTGIYSCGDSKRTLGISRNQTSGIRPQNEVHLSTGVGKVAYNVCEWFDR